MTWDSETSWSKEQELINVKKDTNDSGLESLEDSKYKKFIEKTYQIIQKVEEIGLPKNNEQIKIVTFRPFNAAGFFKVHCRKRRSKKCSNCSLLNKW